MNSLVVQGLVLKRDTEGMVKSLKGVKARQKEGSTQHRGTRRGRPPPTAATAASGLGLCAL